MSQSTNSPSPESINEMVVLFYNRIRAHQRLGPIFAREITADWDQHIETMQQFWRSVLLKTREYRGRPVPAHAKIQGITTDDFVQWLALFQETSLEVFDPATAQEAMLSAQRIASSLWLATTSDPFATPPDWQTLSHQQTYSVRERAAC